MGLLWVSSSVAVGYDEPTPRAPVRSILDAVTPTTDVAYLLTSTVYPILPSADVPRNRVQPSPRTYGDVVFPDPPSGDPGLQGVLMPTGEVAPRRPNRITPPTGEYQSFGPLLIDQLMAWNDPPPLPRTPVRFVRQEPGGNIEFTPYPLEPQFWVATATASPDRPARTQAVNAANAGASTTSTAPTPVPPPTDVDVAIIVSTNARLEWRPMSHPWQIYSSVVASVAGEGGSSGGSLGWAGGLAFPVIGPYFVVAAQISFGGAVIGDIVES
jgi:hypothetical protein